MLQLGVWGCLARCSFLLFLSSFRSPSSSVCNYNFDKSKQCIGAMTIEIDFLQKKSTDSSPYDSDKMAAEFIQQFNNQAFSVSQQVCVLGSSSNQGGERSGSSLRFDQSFPSPLSWCLVSATRCLA